MKTTSLPKPLMVLLFAVLSMNVYAQRIRVVPAEDQLDLLVADGRALTDSYYRILAQEGIDRPRGRRESMVLTLEVFEERVRGFRRLYHLGASVGTVTHQLIAVRTALNNVCNAHRRVSVTEQFDLLIENAVDTMIGLESNYILQTSIVDGRQVAELRARQIQRRRR